MKAATTRSFNSGIAIGVAFLWVGIIMLISRIGLIPYSLKRILISWPILVTYIGLIGLMSREKIGGLILTIIGLIFLFLRIGKTYPGLIPDHLLNIHVYLWPIAIILVGLIFIFNFGNHRSKNIKSSDGESSGENFVKSSFLSEYEENYHGKIFEGGVFKSTLSGMTIDLRGALVKSDTIYIDISVFLGNIELYLPSNCTIENRAKPLFGSIDDKRRVAKSSSLGEFKLVITGSVIMGGVEIKN